MLLAEVAIVGSGFGASLLARILRCQGRRVVVVERHSHPRFALGESSTPLANFCLERLAARWDLPELWQLAAWGRWREAFPELRCGLKRGFSFYRHRPDQPYSNDGANRHRLLVAASPDDAVADTHWLRSDLDAFLLDRAREAGAEVLERVELTRAERVGDRMRLEGVQRGRRLTIEAELVVDASGAGRFLPGQLGLPNRPTPFDTRLVFGHFTDVGDFVGLAREGGAKIDPGPYPDEKAAVHHILDGGWMYVLPFDHGMVSAGFLIRRDRPADLSQRTNGHDGAGAWRAALAAYPTLADQFAGARPIRPIADLASVPRRCGLAAGEGWALLPHTFAFFDPMYSTGIAWTLLAVERLADLVERCGGCANPTLMGPALRDYGRRLETEADQMQRLLAGAWQALPEFDLLVQHSFLYFAAVSFTEAVQRLWPGSGDAAAHGFLGARDAVLEGAFEESERRLNILGGEGRDPVADADVKEFADWVRRILASRNVAGLADPAAANLYPVDLDLLVEKASLLGRTPDEVREALPRLRGAASMGADRGV